MNKYVEVYFAPDEVDMLRNFLRAMNGIRIIEISAEEIEENLKFIELSKIGANNRIVLHGEGEIESFKNVMSAFFPEKQYLITDDPNDEQFGKWLKEKEGRIDI